MPMKLKDVHKFETLNNLNINIYTLSSCKKVLPLKISDGLHVKHIDMLLLEKGGCRHFTLITDLSRLISSDVSKHNGRLWVCRRCLSHFGMQQLLEQHVMFCSNFKTVRTVFPKKSHIQFNNYKKKLKMPFIIIADMEAYVEPIPADENQRGATTVKTAIHKPMSYSYKVISSCSEYDKPLVVYRGENAVEHFLEALFEEERLINAILSNAKPIDELTDAQVLECNTAKLCGICENPFVDGEVRVRDHCHLTGKFR